MEAETSPLQEEEGKGSVKFGTSFDDDEAKDGS